MSKWLKGSSTVMLAAVMLVPACQQQTHDEHVQEANQRWLTTRSALMMEMAEQQFQTGDLNQAERTVNEALQLDPERSSLHVLAGRIAIERGRLERAYHLFSTAIELAEDNAPAYYYRGLVLQRWRQFDNAHQDYQKAYELSPDEVDYLLASTEVMVELERVEDAIKVLESKQEYFDQNATLRAALGHLYMTHDRPDRAAEYFEKASVLDPDNLKLREELALARIASGENEAGIAVLERLLEKESHADRRDLRRTLARAYMEMDQTRKAREEYLRMAQGERGRARDWVRLAELAWEEENLSDALFAANRAIEMAPREHEAYLLAGLVWQRRGDLDEALRMFDRAAMLVPEDNSPVILRGIALQNAGRPTAAAEAYREALERRPDDARAQQLLDRLDGDAAG